MKKLLFLMVYLFGLGWVYGQEIGEEEIPIEVSQALHEKFPAADLFGWMLTEDGVFVADFEMEQIDYDTGFKDDGTWEFTAYAIDLNTVPKKILDVVYGEFADMEIVDSQFKETNQGEKLYIFSVEVAKEEGEDSDSLYYLVEVNEKGKITAKNSLYTI